MERLSRLRFINVDRTRMPVRPRIKPRGVPNALQDYPILDSDDLATANDAASQMLGRCHLSVDDADRGAFHCQLNAVAMHDVALAYLSFASPVHIQVPSSADCYTVHTTGSGRASAHVHGQVHELGPVTALVVSPGMAYELTLDRDVPQQVVRIERAAMERQLSRMLGRRLDGPITFEPVFDLTAPSAGRWPSAIQMASQEVMTAQSLLHDGIGTSSLEELLVSTLLYVQDSTYRERLCHPVSRSGRPAVRRSVEYIERHLAEPMSLNDIAAHVRLSPRTIQAGFRADLGMTPVTFIRERRLDAVRRMLLSAVPEDGITVTDAALRWGFNHLGSFSVCYRQRFGESPSQTLRGVRSA